MDSYNLFMILLALYVLILVMIGWYFNNKQKSVSDFWLAGRRISFIPIGFSAAASWMTAGGILAVVGLYMLLGMGSIWSFVAPNIIALLFLAVLVGKIKHLPAITQPELLEQRYSNYLRAPVAIIITVVMILFAVADIKGFALVLEIFFGLQPIYAVAIVAVAVCIYVTLGGFSAVIWTDVIQLLFLATFTIVAALLVMGTATSGFSPTTSLTVTELFSDMPEGWWNPFSIGIAAVMIFTLAIVPGWITEQDPWQKIWATKDEKSARYGMILGAFLIFLVFGICCTIIAVGLNHIYPDIPASFAQIGMGAMAKAEPALLVYIFEHFSPLLIGLSGIGLAAAAMSSTDTFSTSGASCLSRDIYQRYIKPDATMKEMLSVNRISVFLIIIAAAVSSFYIDGILEAIHIATFIASASYFFPLMGGLYWQRATKEGALAGLVVGFIVQVSLTLIDIKNTAPFAPSYLETINPILASHGVILGMILSGLFFVTVSLVTKPSATVNLAPFFNEAAKKLEDQIVVDVSDPEYQKINRLIEQEITGDRVHLQLSLQTSEDLDWNKFVSNITTKHHEWVIPTGKDSVYRLTKPDMLACTTTTRGQQANEIWFTSEPRVENIENSRKEMILSFKEVSIILKEMGLSSKPISF